MSTRDASQTTAPLAPSPDDAPPASWVEKLPGVCGGDARIRTTRIPVWGMVEWRNLGLSDAEILTRHPDLSQADLDAACDYYRQHPDEIDQAIRDNAED
jgi:uncharacterized protein (DUF433 family)